MTLTLLRLITLVLLFLFSQNTTAATCQKKFFIPIKMGEEWRKKEKERIKFENELIKKYPNITKNIKKLYPENYVCEKGVICDQIKNCQMEEDVKNIREVEYLIKIDSGIFISKSYCSVIGKCIGYNDFTHNKNVTAEETRIIDAKDNNIVFYNYFYSAHSKAYKPPFTIMNLKTGREFDLDDFPNFSPDGRFVVEVRSIPEQEIQEEIIPTGFNINIYERNEKGEYIKTEGDNFDNSQTKVLSTFLSRNPSCGKTPYFHSWKNNTEIRLSMLPPKYANYAKKVILTYDEKESKWQCVDDSYPDFKCNPYLPNSTRFISNLAEQQLNNCR